MANNNQTIDPMKMNEDGWKKWKAQYEADRKKRLAALGLAERKAKENYSNFKTQARNQLTQAVKQLKSSAETDALRRGLARSSIHGSIVGGETVRMEKEIGKQTDAAKSAMDKTIAQVQAGRAGLAQTSAAVKNIDDAFKNYEAVNVTNVKAVTDKKETNADIVGRLVALNAPDQVVNSLRNADATAKAIYGSQDVSGYNDVKKKVLAAYGLKDGEYDPQSTKDTLGNRLYWAAMRTTNGLVNTLKANFDVDIAKMNLPKVDGVNGNTPSTTKAPEFNAYTALEKADLWTDDSKDKSRITPEKNIDNKKLNDYFVNDSKRKAELNGNKPKDDKDTEYYEKAQYIQASEEQWNAGGYHYDETDAEDVERRARGLPPKEFLNLYSISDEDQKNRLAGEMPTAVQNSNNVIDAINVYNAKLYTMYRDGKATPQALATLLAEHPEVAEINRMEQQRQAIIQAASDAGETINQDSETMTTLGGKYNIKTLEGAGFQAGAGLYNTQHSTRMMWEAVHKAEGAKAVADDLQAYIDKGDFSGAEKYVDDHPDVSGYLSLFQFGSVDEFKKAVSDAALGNAIKLESQENSTQKNDRLLKEAVINRVRNYPADGQFAGFWSNVVKYSDMGYDLNQLDEYGEPIRGAEPGGDYSTTGLTMEDWARAAEVPKEEIDRIHNQANAVGIKLQERFDAAYEKGILDAVHKRFANHEGGEFGDNVLASLQQGYSLTQIDTATGKPLYSPFADPDDPSTQPTTELSQWEKTLDLTPREINDIESVAMGYQLGEIRPFIPGLDDNDKTDWDSRANGRMWNIVTKQLLGMKVSPEELKKQVQARESEREAYITKYGHLPPDDSASRTATNPWVNNSVTQFIAGGSDTLTMGLMKQLALGVDAISGRNDYGAVLEGMDRAAQQHQLAYGLGSFAGMFVPATALESAAGKVLRKVFPTFVKELPILASMAKGAAGFSAYNGITSVVDGKPVDEVAINMLEGAGWGALFGGLSETMKGFIKTWRETGYMSEALKSRIAPLAKELENVKRYPEIVKVAKQAQNELAFAGIKGEGVPAVKPLSNHYSISTKPAAEATGSALDTTTAVSKNAAKPLQAASKAIDDPIWRAILRRMDEIKAGYQKAASSLVDHASKFISSADDFIKAKIQPGRGASAPRTSIDLSTLPTGKTYLTKPDTKLISSILDGKGIVTKTGDDILLYSIDGVQFDAIKYSDEALADLVKGNKDFGILRVNRVGDAGKNYKFLNAVGEYQPQIAKAEGKNFAAAAGKEGVGVELKKHAADGVREGVSGSLRYFEESQLKTEIGRASFWSGKTDGVGGGEHALSLAKKSGRVTLEGVIETQGILMPEWDVSNPATIQAWRDASEAYARQASGEIRAYIGSTLRPGNIWETVELRILKENPNVTRIIIVDPKTLVEQVIFTR